MGYSQCINNSQSLCYHAERQKIRVTTNYTHAVPCLSNDVNVKTATQNNKNKHITLQCFQVWNIESESEIINRTHCQMIPACIACCPRIRNVLIIQCAAIKKITKTYLAFPQLSRRCGMWKNQTVQQPKSIPKFRIKTTHISCKVQNENDCNTTHNAIDNTHCNSSDFTSWLFLLTRKKYSANLRVAKLVGAK